MDPLDPILPPSPGLPSRRVPAVDRLRRITREGDRPRREPSDGRPPPDRPAAWDEGEEGGEGRVDVRA